MRKLFGALALVLVSTAALAQPTHWVASWSSAQQIAEPENMLPPTVMKDASVRQIVRLSIGGTAFRLRLSNVFGTEPLHLKAVHVAAPISGGAINPASDRALTFSGRADVIIPPGASYLSDPVMLPVAPLSDMAISTHYDEPPQVQTSHPGSRMTSYVLAGDHVADAYLPGATTLDHWYQIASVEVLATRDAGALVALGDSITDGRGSTTNGNDRWTNILALRLNAAGRRLAVLNAGLGGNRLLNDVKGPNALSRVGRDVLDQPGVEAVIVLEGINDLGTLTREHAVSFEDHNRLVNRMIGGYQQIAAEAHAHGIKAYIGTVMPFMGFEFYHPDAANEADRNAVNAWIRVQKAFDGVIDFDAIMRDPAHPDRLNPAYDVGDFLHPSPAGYRVMGEAAAAALLGSKPAGRPHHKKKHR
jgi:lysophospholipase L1-like esterase